MIDHLDQATSCLSKALYFTSNDVKKARPVNPESSPLYVAAAQAYAQIAQVEAWERIATSLEQLIVALSPTVVHAEAPPALFDPVNGSRWRDNYGQIWLCFGGSGEYRKFYNQDDQIITLDQARAAAAGGMFTRIHDDGEA